jgi:uncharacterized membrane protein
LYKRVAFCSDDIIAFIKHWDVYPLFLLNLVFSTQAAYAAPIIMMAQNRQNERDSKQADYQTNGCQTGNRSNNSIEVDKLDKIIRMLEQMENSN